MKFIIWKHFLKSIQILKYSWNFHVWLFSVFKNLIFVIFRYSKLRVVFLSNFKLRAFRDQNISQNPDFIWSRLPNHIKLCNYRKVNMTESPVCALKTASGHRMLCWRFSKEIKDKQIESAQVLRPHMLCNQIKAAKTCAFEKCISSLRIQACFNYLNLFAVVLLTLAIVFMHLRCALVQTFLRSPFVCDDSQSLWKAFVVANFLSFIIKIWCVSPHSKCTMLETSQSSETNSQQSRWFPMVNSTRSAIRPLFCDCS